VIEDVERKLTKFQRYTTKRIHRSEIKNAPYNPRRIGPAERKKLERVIKKLKLIEPPVWNENTGNLVGGHQRISIIDTLEGSQDYYIEVAANKMTEKQEREANIALNNPGAQGQWDIALLADMMRPGDLDLEAVGMTRMDMEIMFEDDPTMASLFSEEHAAPALRSALDDIQAATSEANAIKKSSDVGIDPVKMMASLEREANGGASERADASDAPPPLPTDGPTKQAKPQLSPEEEREKIKALRREHRLAMDEKNDTQFYAVLVFVDRAHREIFMRHVGKDSDDKYVDGHHVAQLCGLSFS
jgi:hypothetical protein